MVTDFIILIEIKKKMKKTTNQHTSKGYCELEINEIINLYNNGMSFTKIGKVLKRQKNAIKKILIENDVWVKNRDKVKKLLLMMIWIE